MACIKTFGVLEADSEAAGVVLRRTIFGSIEERMDGEAGFQDHLISDRKGYGRQKDMN